MSFYIRCFYLDPHEKANTLFPKAEHIQKRSGAGSAEVVNVEHVPDTYSMSRCEILYATQQSHNRAFRSMAEKIWHTVQMYSKCI